MVITKFIQPDFNREFQEERIDTKFANFSEGIVTAFSRLVKHVKIHTFPMGIMGGSFLQCWKLKLYSSILFSNSSKSSQMLFIIVVHLTLI